MPSRCASGYDIRRRLSTIARSIANAAISPVRSRSAVNRNAGRGPSGSRLAAPSDRTTGYTGVLKSGP
jgi:hypothetical protein